MRNANNFTDLRFFPSKIYHRSVQNLIMLAEGYIFQQATPEIENKVIHQKRIQRICKQYIYVHVQNNKPSLAVI